MLMLRPYVLVQDGVGNHFAALFRLYWVHQRSPTEEGVVAEYAIEPNATTLHGFFAADHPPVLTIDSGDTVRFRTLDAGWGVEQFPADWDANLPEAARPQRRRAATIHGEPDGHALCGPVFVRGAQPGMTLGVRIDRLIPGAWGWTFGGGAWADGARVLHRWTIDVAAGTAANQLGHRVALRPFMGVMGVAPAEAGRHATTPPRRVGGNLDCKELIAGSTLYLPIEVAGALFSTGDGHARQGDGELSGTAIECPMDECTLTFTVHDDMPIDAPVAHTPAGWLTLGIGATLDDACVNAVRAMIDFLAGRLQLSRADASVLASVAVDLRITQIVNQVCGVHALLPHDGLLDQSDSLTV
jgi:acetamidase/formamidase